MAVTRNHRAVNQPLPLDYETAPAEAPRPTGFRAYVGGVLYVEGIIVLIMGAMLLTGYWPPVPAHGEPANPISQIGLWLAGGALFYMVVVGVGIFVYNLMHPSSRIGRGDHHPDGAVLRARRYAAMKRRTYYIFDDTIHCEKDAEDAMKARDLY